MSGIYPKVVIGWFDSGFGLCRVVQHDIGASSRLVVEAQRTDALGDSGWTEITGDSAALLIRRALIRLAQDK